MTTVSETAVSEFVKIESLTKDLLDISFCQTLCQGHLWLLLPRLDLLLDLSAFFRELAIEFHMLGEQLFLLLLLVFASGAARCI